MPADRSAISILSRGVPFAGGIRAKAFSALLAALILALFPDVLLGRSTFFFRDYGLFGYPLAYYHRESFWRGDLPLWNPLNHCGLPFLAQWNTLVLYPLSLIYLVLPLPWSLSFFCLAHLFLAGLGMYLLAYQWTGARWAASLAGLAFAFGGLLLSSLKWPNNIAAFGLMPWVVLWVERGWREGGRHLLVAAGAGAMQMLSGAPEIILLTWVLLIALWANELARSASRRAPACRRFVAIILLIGGLAAAQLLPFLDLLAHSQRDPRFADSAWSMPRWGWANFFVPLFRCFPSYHGVFAQYNQYWISSYYVGIAVLGLALLALWQRGDQRTGLLSAIAGVSLVLAMGDGGHLFRWLREAVPLLGFFRFPIKFVALTAFIIPLLAAFGFAQWERSRVSNENRRRRRRLVVLAALFSAMILGILWFARANPLANDLWGMTWRNALAREGFLILGLSALFYWGDRRSSSVRGPVCLVFLFSIWLDLVTHAPSQNPTIATWVYEPGLSQLKPPPTPGNSRALVSPSAESKLNHLLPSDPINDYLTSRLSLFCNCNLLDGIPKVDGFYSLSLREEAQVESLLYASPRQLAPSLNEFLGVLQMTAPGKTVHWQAQTNVLRWASAGQMPVFENATNTLRLMLANDFDPKQVVYLPLEAKDHISVRKHTEAKLLSANFSTRQVQLEVQSSAPSLVVLAQSYFHPWQARVDGAPVRIWRANHGFQALQVPAGRCQVQVVYRDRAFQIGAWLSLATLLACSIRYLHLMKAARIPG